MCVAKVGVCVCFAHAVCVCKRVQRFCTSIRLFCVHDCIRQKTHACVWVYVNTRCSRLCIRMRKYALLSHTRFARVLVCMCSHMQSTTFPIREISTYNGRNWTIRGRVTMKSQIRTFTNDRGNGKVFSIDLLDKDGGEIKASFFNQSVDKFFDLVEAGKIYTFSKGM